MYLINFRDNGIGGNVFAETDQLFDLDQNGQVKQISGAELMKAVGQSNILILVHGFYGQISDVLSFYLSMEDNRQKYLSNHYDAIVGFIWEREESKFGYNHSKEHVKKASSHFRNWMCRLNNSRSTIDVMTHGMGSLVVYNSVQIPENFTIRNIFSIGAGIPQEVFTNVSHMDRVRNRFKNIYVFYIDKDHFSEGELAKNKAKTPMIDLERMIWEKGIARMDEVRLVNITKLITNYPGGYQSLAVVAEFIDTLLSDSQHPLPETLNDMKERIAKSQF